MKINKLIIHDNGDPSVGRFSQSWEVDVPFCITDSTQMDEVDKENVEQFRKEILDIYSDYSEGKIWAMYDFEIKAENEFYEKIHNEAEQKFHNTLNKLKD